MRPAAGRLLLLGAALLYAVAAIGNGLDRWTVTRPQLQVRPQVFAALSLQRDAMTALQAQQPEQAALAATRAIMAAPVEAGSVSLLGAAQLGSGRPDLAYATFKVADRLGWRDISTQAYWVTAGISLADDALIARHLDALMRFAPGLPQSEQVLQMLESSPSGQAQLATYLAQGPSWLVPYARGIARLSPDLFAARLTLLRGAKARGKVTDCGTVADAINDLAYQQSRYGEAAQLWQLACRSDGAGLVDNGQFTRAQRDRDLPFEWTLPGAGGVSAGLSGGVLSARNDNPGDAIVAQQFVFAPAGPVRLTWQIEADQDTTQLANAATLLCLNRSDLGSGLKPVRSSDGSYALDLTVPAGCSPQQLVLRVPREAGEVRFRKVALAPLRAAGS